MTCDPYAFSTLSEYRSVVMKIYLDNELDFGGLFAETLPYFVQRKAAVELDDRAKILLIQLDEMTTFLLLVSLKLKAYSVSDPDPRRTAMSGLLSGITSELSGIRHLVGAGLVFPAIQLCRPLRDMVNVALLCVIDEDVTQRFIMTITPDTANRFWHEFLSREKDLKAIDKALSQHSGSKSELLNAFETDLSRMLGMMVHPSLGGGVLAMEVDLMQMFSPAPGVVFEANGPLSFSINQIYRLLIGVFQPGIVSGLYLDDLIPAADQTFVNQIRQSLVELFFLTVVRLSRHPWDDSASA